MTVLRLSWESIAAGWSLPGTEFIRRDVRPIGRDHVAVGQVRTIVGACGENATYCSPTARRRARPRQVGGDLELGTHREVRLRRVVGQIHALDLTYLGSAPGDVGPRMGTAASFSFGVTLYPMPNSIRAIRCEHHHRTGDDGDHGRTAIWMMVLRFRCECLISAPDPSEAVHDSRLVCVYGLEQLADGALPSQSVRSPSTGCR